MKKIVYTLLGLLVISAPLAAQEFPGAFKVAGQTCKFVAASEDDNLIEYMGEATTPYTQMRFTNRVEVFFTPNDHFKISCKDFPITIYKVKKGNAVLIKDDRGWELPYLAIEFGDQQPLSLEIIDDICYDAPLWFQQINNTIAARKALSNLK